MLPVPVAMRRKRLAHGELAARIMQPLALSRLSSLHGRFRADNTERAQRISKSAHSIEKNGKNVQWNMHLQQLDVPLLFS